MMRARIQKLRQRARRLINRSRGGAVILLYHRVCDTTFDPLLVCVRPEHFAQHLAVLSRDYQVLSLHNLMLTLREGRLPERTVVVTFDDGYADNLWNAEPLLDRHGVPAAIYVATRLLGQQAESWWDELEHILFLSPTLPEVLRVTVDGSQYTWRLARSNTEPAIFQAWNVHSKHTPTPRHQAYRDLLRLLRTLPAEKQEAVLASLRDQLDEPPIPRPTHRFLTPDELRSLAAGEFVEIGAHSVTHSMLTSLSLKEQRREMTESKRQLEAILEQPVRTFAYPFGGYEMVSRHTIALAKDCGFESACGTIAEPVTLRSNSFFLPRFVARDWTGDEFAARVREFFG